MCAWDSSTLSFHNVNEPCWNWNKNKIFQKKPVIIIINVLYNSELIIKQNDRHKCKCKHKRKWEKKSQKHEMNDTHTEWTKEQICFLMLNANKILNYFGYFNSGNWFGFLFFLFRKKKNVCFTHWEKSVVCTRQFFRGLHANR